MEKNLLKAYKIVKYVGILLTSVATASGSGYMLFKTLRK
jgi:hypothetical protein